MPGNPWIFSGSRSPAPGVPAFQGEHSLEILTETLIGVRSGPQIGSAEGGLSCRKVQ